MRSSHASFALLIAFLLPGPAAAQLPKSRLKAIFPVTGQTGSTLELRLASGDDLEEMTALHFTHPGIVGKLRMQEVEGQPQPVDNLFDVTIAGDVPPGIYEVRASGLFGVTNPRRFAVTQRPVVAEKEANNTREQAQTIELNTSLSGKIEGGTDVDCFKFTAQPGQRVVMDCLAERLDSSLDASLTLYDATGRRVAFAHNSNGDDPVLVFDVPSAGEYVLELHDHTYRNGVDYVYRLDVHTGPQIAFVMPPAGVAGTRSKFTLFGYNFPGGQKTDQALHRAALERVDVEIDVPGEDALLRMQNLVRSYEVDVDAFSWVWNSPQGPANPVRIGISDRPAQAEAEPNNEPGQPQAITAPAEIAGQLLQPGDIDWFAFAGKPGEVYWIEVVGQRVGSSLDPVLIVEEVTRSAEGAEQVRRLTQQDDDGTNVAQNIFDTFTDDPVYRLSIDKEATYRIAVYDRYGQGRGSPLLRYRLCIRPDEPDFRVVAVAAENQNNAGVASPVDLRKGDAVGIPVYALRKYGYEGPIEIRVEGLPPGVECPGTTIGSKETTGQLVFRAAENAPEGVAMVRLISSAVIDPPAAQREFEAAEKRIADAEKGLADLRKKLDETSKQLEQAIAQRDETARALQADPDNNGLKQQLAQREQALAGPRQQFQQASDALAGAEKSLVDARLQAQAADLQRRIGRRHVRHLVRSGCIMIPGQNNVPSEGRLAQTFAVAVLKEMIPFEVRTQTERIAACQSRQILVPIQLVKRNGFDEKVSLNVAGVPKNSNLQVTNTAIEKGQDSVLVPIFVKENTPPGTYAIWFTAQGQISYSRNPDKTQRLKAERDAVVEKLKAAQAAQQQSTETKNRAVQKATEAATALQQAQQRKQQADQLVTQKTKERDDAKGLKEAADRKVEEAAKVVAAAELALKAAQEAATKEPDNADLKAKVEAEQQTLQTAQKGLEQVTAERDELTKKLAEADRLLTEATTAQKQAEEGLKTSETGKTDADKAKTDAEAAEKAALEAVKQLEERKKGADKRVEEAEKQSSPQNKNYATTTVPIVFDVVPNPVKLTASVPNGGALKAGQSLEITVKVERLSGFKGPVTLSLPLPPGVAGLSGTVEVPPDQTEARLTITAAADATTGQLANMVVRATADWNGPQLVDVPVAIKVDK